MIHRKIDSGTRNVQFEVERDVEIELPRQVVGT